MPARRRFVPLTLITALALASAGSAGAQTPPPALPTTVVMVNLTIKSGVDRAQLAATMPSEVRDTVQAYLDGRIQQWYGRSDGSGVMFLVNASSVDEARKVMDALPLAKAGLANFEFTPLGPLGPLRYLLAPAAPKTPQGPQ